MVRFLLCLAGLAAIASLPLAYGKVDWTPLGLDWDAVPTNDTVPSGIWMDTNAERPTTDLALLSGTQLNNQVDVVSIAVAAGYLWLGATVAGLIIEAKNAFFSCKDAITGKGGVGACAESLFTTALAFGGARSAAKAVGAGRSFLRTIFPHRFQSNHHVEIAAVIEMTPPFLLSRADAMTQLAYNDLIRHHLRSLSRADTEPEFVGYAEKDHPFALKEFKTHPLVPRFRFEHSELGRLELVAADTVDASHVTLAYADNSTGLHARSGVENLKREDKYKEELLKKGTLVARFDAGASHGDPYKLHADAGQLYNHLLPSVKCGLKARPKKGHHVLEVQYYDVTHKATFGFGTVGIFNDVKEAEKGIAKLQPKKLPLKKCFHVR